MIAQEFIAGKVIQGLQNGRRFGFPTANIILQNTQKTPDEGIYAVHVLWKDTYYKGMLYVGKRPTLNLKNISIEIHIFNFHENIYGETICFKVMKKIRDDRKFDSIDALIQQINIDKNETLQYFSE